MIIKTGFGLLERRRRKGNGIRNAGAAKQADHDVWKVRVAFLGRLKTYRPILLSLILAFWSCTLSPPPGYRYQGGLSMTQVSLASPRVGTVVMMRAVGDAAKIEDAFTAAFQSALADTLRAKGYEPVELYSGVFNKGIGGLSPFKHLREMRPMLQQPVFENPAEREVAGVFVAWVELHLDLPEIPPGPLGGTFIKGDIPAPRGHLFIEIFSPEGEPLVWDEGVFLGYERTGAPAAAVPAATNLAGYYRVLPPEEIASTEVAEVLQLLRPYARQTQP